MKSRLLEVHLYYSTMDVTEKRQKPKYTPTDIFSTVGGLMGLFLGISLLSVLELVEFAVSSLRMCVASRWNRKQTAPNEIEMIEKGNTTPIC